MSKSFVLFLLAMLNDADVGVVLCNFNVVLGSCNAQYHSKIKNELVFGVTRDCCSRFKRPMQTIRFKFKSILSCIRSFPRPYVGARVLLFHSQESIGNSFLFSYSFLFEYF